MNDNVFVYFFTDPIKNVKPIGILHLTGVYARISEIRKYSRKSFIQKHFLTSKEVGEITEVYLVDGDRVKKLYIVAKQLDNKESWEILRKAVKNNGIGMVIE